MKELNKLTIKEASDKLIAKEITSVELTEACLAQIEKLNPEINAYITVLKDEAIISAKASDVRRKGGEVLSQIDGIPIAIKDNMCMEGTKTTAASKILENFVAPYDATVIYKLKEAGAVIIGKTNLDEFAMGSSTENSSYGVTKNPHDSERVAGGSSGGSAAAVAADMCLAALGSDTGGSIRQPASFCGAVGFKPTYGMVSRYGLLAMASSLDQIGPITKTVEDAEILMKIIEGEDRRDSTSVNDEIRPVSTRSRQGGMTNVELETPRLGSGQAISNFQFSNIKIGIPKEYFAEGLDAEVKKVIVQAIEKFKSQGAEIKEISLPHSKYALSCYYIIMPVEVASNLGRYDGIKFGHSEIRNPNVEIRNLLDVYLNSRSNGFGEEAKRRIILGTYTSSAGYIDQYYNQAQKVRAKIVSDFEQAFSEVDFILGPVTPTTAFKIGEKIDDPLTMYLSDIYTIAVNLAGLPAASIPVGKIDNLPVGLHIIGPQFSDEKMLAVAREFNINNDC